MWRIVFFLFPIMALAEIGDNPHDAPYFAIELQVISFDEKEIHGRLKNGDAVRLERKAIKRPVVSDKFNTYNFTIDEWAQAKTTPKKSDHKK